MTVPTPLVWSTRTAIARSPAGHLHVDDGAVDRAEGVVGDLGPGPDRLAHDPADDLRGIREGTRQDRREVEHLDRDLVGADATRQRDVRRRDDDVSGGRRGRCPGTATPATAISGEDDDRDKCHDRQEDPDEQDESIRALQVGSPRQRWCDRWHHSSTAQEPRDYTKGLGPLGGNGRKSFVLQGSLQGSIPGVAGAGAGLGVDVQRPVGRRPTGRMWTGFAPVRARRS